MAKDGASVCVSVCVCVRKVKKGSLTHVRIMARGNNVTIAMRHHVGLAYLADSPTALAFFMEEAFFLKARSMKKLLAACFINETRAGKHLKKIGAFFPTRGREPAIACPNTCVSKQGSTSTPNGTMFWPLPERLSGNPNDAGYEVIMMSQRRINREPEGW